MKKKNAYTDQDVKRWAEADAVDFAPLIERVREGDIDNGRVLRRLSRMHESAGLTQIAQRNFGKALGHFGAAAAVWASLLERHATGEAVGRDLVDRTTGMPFILANAASDCVTIWRLADVYDVVFRDPQSRKQESSTMIVRALSIGDLETARQLAASLPDLSRAQTSLALINHDEKAFAGSMARSAETWKDIIRSERLQRFPDAVCNHKSIGWIKLAERVWGKRPDVDLEPGRIPKEIFEVEPELIDPGI